MNSSATSFSLSILSKLKAELNTIWNSSIRTDKNNTITLINSLMDNGSLEELDPTQLGFSNHQNLASRLMYIKNILEMTPDYIPHFLDIGLALYVQAQTEEQKKLASLIIKTDAEAQSVWLMPEKLSEVRAEKISLLTNKIYDIGKKAYPQLQGVEGNTKLLSM